MTIVSSGSPLAAQTVVGRERELERIARFLEPDATLLALVLRGEAGIGKSTLWRTAIASAEAAGWRVLRTRATELEAEQAEAGLADLLGAVPPAALEGLPTVQRVALDTVLLRSGGSPSRPVDARTIATATLAALTALADDGPVLLAVDDSQWLDRATIGVLAQVAGRLDRRRVRVLTTRRKGALGFEDGIEHDEREVFDVGPLSLAALHHVLRDRLGRSFPRRTLAQIDRAAGGNPLFALELGRALLGHPGVPAGGPLPVPADIRALVDSRVRDLPHATRAWLLRLALAPHLPLPVDEVAAAFRADVIVRGRDGVIEFSHPIFAAAVHELATPAERRRTHADLAESEADPERRARHLALSIEGADPEVAAALDAAVAAARLRGSVTTAAELAQLAVDRTAAGDHLERDRRRLALAVLLGQGGDPRAADAIGRDVLATSDSPAIRARACYVLAGSAEMVDGIEAAMRYADLAVAEARDEPRIQAEVHAYAARAFDIDIPQKVEHARAAIAAAEAGGIDDLVLADALIGRAEATVFAGEGFDGDALERAETVEAAAGKVIRESRDSVYIRAWLEVHTEQLDAAERDFQALADYTEAAGLELRNARSHVALTVLAIRRGDLDRAEHHMRVVEEIDARIGGSLDWTLIARATIAAHRGLLGDAAALADEAIARSAAHLWQLSESHVARGLTALIRGDAAVAVASLDVADSIARRSGMREPGTGHFEPDRIEALILAGELDRARAAIDTFEAHGRRFDRPWILGTSLRCRALLAADGGDLDAAAAALDAALVQHRRLPMRIVEARTQLVLGMVERRRRRYQAARAAFIAARELAAEAGAGAWSGKADAELARTHLRETPAGLTPTERQIAELAAEGVTNREIGARLYVSPKTVEANLARADRKLGIGTRAQLSAALARSADQT